MNAGLPPGREELLALQELRGEPALLLRSTIDDAAARTVYEALRRIGPVPSLTVVLATGGGSVTAARRMALLLRELAQRVTIMVPYRATSAGTLLCLGADALVLGPMAELSPVDASLVAAGPVGPDAPGAVSAQDVRAFGRMSRDWFGVRRRRDRLQVLALMGQRVFPPTLGSLYRADRLARATALELLAHGLPGATEAARRALADRLVDGFDAHDHVIVRAEARALGLPVVDATPEEERLLWELVERGRRASLQRPGEPGQDGMVGQVMTAGLSAVAMQRWRPDPSTGADVAWELTELETTGG